MWGVLFFFSLSLFIDRSFLILALSLSLCSTRNRTSGACQRSNAAHVRVRPLVKSVVQYISDCELYGVILTAHYIISSLGLVTPKGKVHAWLGEDKLEATGARLSLVRLQFLSSVLLLSSILHAQLFHYRIR
jgi:hypothetical protein